MGPEMSAVFMPLGSFVMVVFIIWFVTRQKQAKVQARTDLHKHLLDKFGSGNELAEFLESEGGKKMLGELWEEKGESAGTDHEVLSSRGDYRGAGGRLPRAHIQRVRFGNPRWTAGRSGDGLRDRRMGDEALEPG